MAWTSMHFAVGMCGGAALTLAPCLILRRGWRFIPAGMTLGGLWALAPDMPRLWREDFPSLPFASALGAKDLELWLHSIGDLFFFHHSLDAQPREFALLGLAMVIGLYNLSLLGLLRSRNGRPSRRTQLPHRASPNPTRTSEGRNRATSTRNFTGTTPPSNANPVIGRIGVDKSA